MKRVLILVSIASLAWSCNSKTELEKTKEELHDKKGELHAVEKEIKALEEKIKSLDSTLVEEKLLDVYLSEIKKTDFESFVDVQGIVKTDKNVTVIPEASGVIKQIFVREGQKVKVGQVLAQVDNVILKRNIAELNTQLELAEEIFQKQKKLREQNVGTEVQFLEAKNRRDGLLSSKATLQAQVSKTKITSPIEGKIDEIFPNKGEMASPSSPFARIVSTNNLYINSEVSEAFYSKVSVGDSIKVVFPMTGDKEDLKLTYKGNYINPNNRTFKVQASLANVKKTFPPNTLTIVKLRDDFKPNTLVIPTNVIQSDLKGNYVFVVKGKNAFKTYINTGGTYNSKTQIVEGLKEGDQLVVKGFKALTDDIKVNVLK